jgi:flagellar basal-body rod protein FlgF
MNGALYTAFSGMRAQMDALDIVANNLANVNTAGFKEEKPFLTVLNQVVAADPERPAAVANSPVTTRSAVDLTEGSLQPTHRDLDVGLTGNALLAVDTPRGVRYTRNGHLTLNSQSVLCAAGGLPVIGESGKPIHIGPGELVINEDGELYVAGTPVDRLKLVAVDSPAALLKEGDSLLDAANGTTSPAKDAKVRQGYLEQSNVNAMSSVVGMVGILRQYEALQKTINVLMNEVNSKSIEKLSR